MSQFLPESQQTDGQIRTPSKGPDAFLSRDEETFLTRMLSYPESFPPKFKSWLTEYLAVNMQPIPRSQVQGLSQFGITAATPVLTAETTTSTTYTDLATAGPTITGLSDGQYLLFYTAAMFNSAGASSAMNVRLNSTDPTNDDNAALSNAGANGVSVISLSVADLRNSNNNTVTAKYRVNSASTGTFFYRRMFALKIGN